ncbi:hypothetical protein [Vibrio cholerae]|uniref:hypothetical protein n=1 Tax=Vibrio cholerae TaxID=666 RepID=UPI0030170840
MPPATPPPTKAENQPRSSKNLQKHISTLKAFQKYRTGEDERTFEETGLEPKAITESINFAIDVLSESETELSKAKLAAVTKERDQLYKLNQEFADFAKRQGWKHVLIDEFYALKEKQ